MCHLLELVLELSPLNCLPIKKVAQISPKTHDYRLPVEHICGDGIAPTHSQLSVVFRDKSTSQLD